MPASCFPFSHHLLSGPYKTALPQHSVFPIFLDSYCSLPLRTKMLMLKSQHILFFFLFLIWILLIYPFSQFRTAKLLSTPLLGSLNFKRWNVQLLQKIEEWTRAFRVSKLFSRFANVIMMTPCLLKWEVRVSTCSKDRNSKLGMTSQQRHYARKQHKYRANLHVQHLPFWN